MVGIESDISSVKNDALLVPTGSTRYKLPMRVTSDSHSRFLDLVRAMIQSAQPVMSISCKHELDNQVTVPQMGPVLKMYTFDELLGRWPDAWKGEIGDYIDAPRFGGQSAHAQQPSTSSDDDEEDLPSGQYHSLATAEEEMKIF
jgi:hypothetical protein